MQHILDKYNISVDYDTILTRWDESHRHYHNSDHLYSLLEKIGLVSEPGSVEYEKLVLCALFHDLVYQPGSTTNEVDSANLMLEWCLNPKLPVIQEVKDMILSTANHQSMTPLQEKFNSLDLAILTEGSWEDLEKWENGIAQEYIPVVGMDNYYQGRRQFLEKMADRYITRSSLFYDLIGQFPQ